MLKKQNALSFVIADDDSNDQGLIQEAIKSIGIAIQYTSVIDGSQLLDLLLKTGDYSGSRQGHPDVVILDLNVPVLNGLNALRLIKRNPLLREIPIFILHTRKMDNYLAQCRELGVAGLYVKPNTPESLKNILNEIYSICGGR